MIDSVFNLIGLDYNLLDIPDDIMVVIMSAILLFVISEFFRLLELIVSRLTQKKGR